MDRSAREWSSWNTLLVRAAGESSSWWLRSFGTSGARCGITWLIRGYAIKFVIALVRLDGSELGNLDEAVSVARY